MIILPVNMISGVPQVLRAIAIVLVVVGAFFRIEHWPWTEVIFFAAWVLTLIALLWRPLGGQPLVNKEAARDLFTFGLVSVIVMRMLHLPGKGIALGVWILGAIGLLWYERDCFFPGKDDKASKPWLFYLALALVVIGTLFRIQHWPYSTAMLIGGLALAALWFWRSMMDDRKGQ